MKTTMIITEKKRVSEAIARALAPETFDDFGCSSALHNDIVTVRRLNRGENADNSGNYYFNVSGSFPYEMKPEHLDHMGHKSARRVRRKMRYINEHIVSDLERPVLEVMEDECTIEDICDSLEGGDYPQIDKLDFQTDSLTGAVTRTLNQLEKQGRVVEQSGLYFPTEAGQELVSEQQKNLVVPEDINYFVFKRNGSLVIVLDTYGNPLKYRQAKRGYLHKIILEAKNWKELEGQLTLSPSFQDFNPRDLKSHVVRMFLFNHVLAKRRMPCDHNDLKAGQPINLEKVIAATDLDIAGSSIFSDVIDFANQYADKWGCEPITRDMLYRMRMQTMEPEGIKDDFDNPETFDWENAYAGKARSVFDYLYGKCISQELRFFNKNPALRLSSGRTLFLGLKKLIQEEQRLRNEDEKQYIYLAFNGLLDLDQIKQAIEDREYVAMHLKQERNYVSHPRFLHICGEDEIGTHTTRYKLAGRLERMKVLSIIDNKLFSSPYGNAYYAILSSHLDSSPVFNISDWNANLMSIISEWRTDTNQNRPRNKEEMESEFNRFMRVFLPGLQRHFRYLSPRRYKEITQKLSEAHHHSSRLEYRERRKEQRYEQPDDAFLLIGTDSILRGENIEELIDPETNTPRYGARSKIIRFVPQQPLELLDYVRRTFNISRDHDFTVVSAYNSKALLGMRNEDYTVFRTEVPEGTTLKDFLKKGIRIDQYTECELDESNFEEEDEQTAHESLMIHDVQRSDIAGQEGLWLAQEYHKPWYHTHDKQKKKANGKVNVAGFDSGDHHFDRIERYEFGVVHNFESLLIAMLDKYNMPFWKTARLAEDMYLNAGR